MKSDGRVVLEKRGKWLRKKGKHGQDVWVPDPASLVYDPNAPERIVPGTKAQAKAQRARVKAQEKAVRKARSR